MGIIKKEKWDRLWIGFLVGLFGSLIGFVLFAIGFVLFTGETFSQFWNDWFLGIPDWQSRILTFSVLIDVVLFYICVRNDMYKFSKGLMLVLVLAVLAVSWLEFRNF
ncbi:MAG: hypothetical protein ACKVOK_10805 [Flavobacteriales bacterium]